MLRSMFKLWLVVIALSMGLTGLSSPSPSLAQGTDDMKTVEAALLRAPDKCGTPCVWIFRVGQQTKAEFRQFAASVFPQATVSKMAADATGIYASGVSLQITPEYIFQFTDRNVVNSFYVRVVLAETQKAGVVIDGFSLAEMLRSFGKPHQAFLIHGDTKNNLKPAWFRLLIYFHPQHALYVMTGIMRAGKVCLAPTDIDTLTLYRLGGTVSNATIIAANSNARDELRFETGIEYVTNQTVDDLARIMANPQTECLTLR